MPPIDNSTPPGPPDSPEKLYLDNLELIEKLAAAVARRYHASKEEAEEFSQEFHIKLLEADYAVFRKFQGTSTLTTYLTAVAGYTFMNFREKRWGKWRPSAVAKALEPVAVLLEQLFYRDGLTFDQACQTLQINHRVTASRRELLEIWKRLPDRTPRRIEGEEQLRDLPANDTRPEEGILDHQLRATRERVRKALYKVLQELPKNDWRLIKLRVLEDFKIVTIAPILNTESKPLYRRVEKILARLQLALKREGVGWEQVADLLNRPDFGDSFQWRRRKRLGEN